MATNNAINNPGTFKISVAGGGTGGSSFTAYSVLCGGTTSTGVLQNVSGVGTSGQVLTSNGAGTLPTWKNTGAGSTGVIIQVVSTTLTSKFTASSASYTDLTGLSVSITPSSSSNKVLVQFVVNAVGSGNTDPVQIQIVRGSTAIGIGDASGSRTQCTTATDGSTASTAVSCVSGIFLDSPATTSSTTYKLQALNAGANTIVINAGSSDANGSNNPRTISTIIVMEVTA